MFNTKIHELLIVLSATMSMLGKEDVTPALVPSVLFVCSNIGFYSWTIENVIDAEQSIRDAYYDLDWTTSSVLVRKMLHLAKTQPMQIKFGKLFGRDRTSLERFTKVVRMAYDISLMLLRLAGRGQ